MYDCLWQTERFPSGQRGQTVNLLVTPSKVRILLSPNGGLLLRGRPLFRHTTYLRGVNELFL